MHSPKGTSRGPNGLHLGAWEGPQCSGSTVRAQGDCPPGRQKHFEPSFLEKHAATLASDGVQLLSGGRAPDMCSPPELRSPGSIRVAASLHIHVLHRTCKVASSLRCADRGTWPCAWCYVRYSAAPLHDTAALVNYMRRRILEVLTRLFRSNSSYPSHIQRKTQPDL